MKYQIYLNKETSELINTIAINEKKKPATLLKNLLEVFFESAMKAKELSDKKGLQ